MPLVVSPVLLSDLPSVHRLSLSVEPVSTTGSLLFPYGASETSVAYLVEQDEKNMRDPNSTSRHIIVRDIPDGEDAYGYGRRARGKIVSYATWNFFVTPEEGAAKEGVGGDRRRDGGGAYYESWPPDAHHEALKALVEMGRKKREDIMGNKRYAFLASLCTSLAHRRMGAASKLIKWGLALADAHLLPTYVESTPNALHLYLGHGFQKVDTMTVDLHRWGRDHVQEHTILIRPAKRASNSPNEIAISPVLINADFTAFDRIGNTAFTPDSYAQVPPSPNPSKPTSIFPLIFKDVPSTLDPSHRTTSFIENSLTDPTSHYLKAFIPSTNKTIAFALFHVCPTPSLRPQFMRWHPSANHTLINAFFGKMHENQERYMKGKPYLLVQELAVLPGWQRKGVGRRLLGWGLERADTEGWECWLDASKEGLGLYKKFGFRDIGCVEVELGEWGGEEGVVERAVEMVRGVGEGAVVDNFERSDMYSINA